MYGKQTECAIAATSLLAEVYDDGVRLSAGEVAERRDLPRPSVSKALSVLSQAGIVSGTPGPGGGFALSRHPSQITMYEVFRLFEREDDRAECPFGGGICGEGEGCPLHDDLALVKSAMDRFLHETTFDRFRVAAQQREKQASASRDTPGKAGSEESGQIR